MTGSHNHAHDHGASSREGQRKALWVSLVANGAFLLIEVFGGIAFHSLALLADAAHMFSDVAGLSIALVAQQLLTRPATAKRSYGLQRSDVLGAQFNGLMLLAVAGWIIFEAINRIGEPAEVKGGGLLIVAIAGLLVNVGSAIMLARSRGRSLNMRGAYLHMLVDAAGSVGAIAAGVAVIGWKANWVDPTISMLIAVLVLWSAWSLLKDATNVLLESAPGDIDMNELETALLDDPQVTAVHHLHVWSLASDVAAFSGHVVLADQPDLHNAQTEGERLKTMLHDRFGIDHATLELECHPCVAESDAASDHDHDHQAAH